MLPSRLGEKNLLEEDIRISHCRKREQEVLQFFSAERGFTRCYDVQGLLKALGLEVYDPNELRRFINSSKQSLKCVLLHNTNRYGAVPLGHSVVLQKTCESVKTAIEVMKYLAHQSVMCVDLKMVIFLLGQ